MGLELIAQLASSVAGNKYTAGVMMIMLNIGTSYLVQDLLPLANRLFQHRWARRIVFFVIFFTATRDLMASLILTIVCTLLLDFVLNEQSRYCLIPYACRSLNSDPPPREGFASASDTTISRHASRRRTLSRQQRFLLNMHQTQRWH